MGLTFTVGNPSDVFIEASAEVVRRTLESNYRGHFVLDSPEEPYCSEEVGWSGWAALQERAQSVLPATSLAHLLSMDAWSGVYVPCATEIGAFEFDAEQTPLNVAGLHPLIEELECIGAALGLAVDDAGLRELARGYLEDDDRVDDDMDVQTYAQLLLAAHEAMRRRQPLWIVK
jgi:hypothetical protein